MNHIIHKGTTICKWTRKLTLFGVTKCHDYNNGIVINNTGSYNPNIKH